MTTSRCAGWHRAAVLLAALSTSACQAERPALEPTWGVLPHLTRLALDSVWGLPTSQDSMAPGGAGRVVYSGGRQAIVRADDAVVQLSWAAFPGGSRRRLAAQLGVPPARLVFRPDSLFAAFMDADSTVLLEAHDNGDRTWTLHLVRAPARTPPVSAPTERWLRDAERSSPRSR